MASGGDLVSSKPIIAEPEPDAHCAPFSQGTSKWSRKGRGMSTIRPTGPTVVADKLAGDRLRPPVLEEGHVSYIT